MRKKEDWRRANLRAWGEKEERPLDKASPDAPLVSRLELVASTFPFSLSNFVLGFWCLWLKVAFMTHSLA